MNQDMMDLLKEELGLTPEELDTLDADGLKSVYEHFCEVEEDECDKGEPLSKRGETASDIVDYMWDNYAN